MGLSRFVFLLVATAASLLAAGCTSISRLSDTAIEGTRFNHYLGRDYRELARAEAAAYDNGDAAYFSEKALFAAKNLYVEPTLLEERELPEESVPALEAARGALIAALVSRMGVPGNWEPLADAQVSFDCWIENASENDPKGAADCRARFDDAMGRLEGEARAEEAFMVFFPFNSDKPEAASQKTFAAVAQLLKANAGWKVVLTGNTDTSGPEVYNTGLSGRRAEAARKALAGLGIGKERIELFAEGERNLLVQTGDNTREPRNRRTDILVSAQ